VRNWQSLWQFIFNAGLFVRFAAIGGSIVTALLGAGTTRPQLTAVYLLVLLVGAVAFHNYTYVLNDLVDLPIDRTEPRRAQFPLVRGIVQPGQARLFMFLQIPIPFAVTAVVEGNGSAYGALAAGFVLMTVYNVWGKSITLPILTDLAQGMAWACLALWAALAAGGAITPLTGVLFAFLLVYIPLINGVHGALRDLPNDAQHRVRSTAGLLGARLLGDGIFIPRRLKQYARLLQLLLFVIIFWPLISNWFDYRPLAWGMTLGIEIIVAFWCWRWLNKAMEAAENRAQMLAYGALHLMASFSALAALFFGYMGGVLQGVIAVLFLGPLLTHAWTRNAIRWGMRQSPVPPTFPTPSPPSHPN
jgi:4-hydroxybenzoate polyprenyltransferase